MAQKSLLFGDLPSVHPQDLWKTSAGDRSIPCVTWNSSGYMELQKVRTDTPLRSSFTCCPICLNGILSSVHLQIQSPTSIENSLLSVYKFKCFLVEKHGSNLALLLV